MTQANLSRHETAGDKTAKRHREIQAKIDKTDKREAVLRGRVRRKLVPVPTRFRHFRNST